MFVNERCRLWRQECADVDYPIGKSLEDDSLYDVVDLDLPTLDEVVDAEVVPSSNREVATEMSRHNVQDEGITTNDSFDSDFGDFHESANTETLDTNSQEPGATIVKIPLKKSSGAKNVHSDLAISIMNSSG